MFNICKLILFQTKKYKNKMFVYKNHISLYLKIFYFQLKLVWPISPPALHSLCMAHTHPTNYDLDNAPLAIAASGCLRLRIQWWGMSFSSKPPAWCQKRGVTLPSQPAADVRKTLSVTDMDLHLVMSLKLTVNISTILDMIMM